MVLQHKFIDFCLEQKTYCILFGKSWEREQEFKFYYTVIQDNTL